MLNICFKSKKTAVATECFERMDILSGQNAKIIIKIDSFLSCKV